MKQIVPIGRFIVNRLFPLALREIGLVAAILFVALATLTFLKIAYGVSDAETRAFDESVLLALRSPADTADPIGPAWLETMFTDITSLGSFAVLTIITLIATGYLLIIGKRGAAFLVLVAVTGGGILNVLMKLSFERPRPDLVAHIVEVATSSFPSGHAMQSAATYLTLGALMMRMEARWAVRIYVLVVSVAVTLLIGVSRIYLGVHWPTDVLAGWSAGAAWAILCWSVAVFLQRRGKLEGPGEITEPPRERGSRRCNDGGEAAQAAAPPERTPPPDDP